MADNPLMRPGRVAPESDHGFSRPYGPKVTTEELQTYADELNDRRMSLVMGWHWFVSVDSDSGNKFLDRTSAEMFAHKQRRRA